MKSLILFSTALLFLGAPTIGKAELFDPPFYSSKEIHGRIVDDETGQAIEGAIIVAQWELFEPGPGHGGHRGDTMNVLEVVSDKNGNYKIPGWGPRPLLKYLDNRAPSLMVFKPVYYPGGDELHYPRRANDTQVNRGQSIVIRLRKFTGKPQEYWENSTFVKQKGDIAEYVLQIEDFQSSLGWDAENTNWKFMPHMVLAIEQERLRLKKSGVDTAFLSSIARLAGGETVVRDYLKQTLGVDLPIERHVIRVVPSQPSPNAVLQRGVAIPSGVGDSGQPQEDKKFSIRPLPQK